MSIAAVLVGLASATCFALSTVLQQRAAKQEKTYKTLDPRLVGRLLRRRMWLGSWAPDAAGIALQALALRLGPLALVQPVLVSGMFLAIPLEAAFDRRRPDPRDMVAVGLSGFGLAAFLAAADPHAGVTSPSLMAWFGVATGAGGAAGICVLLAVRARGSRRGALLGVATGVLYAVTAALLKTVMTKLTADPLALLADWRLYALVAVGAAGLVLNQNAFQTGSLAAPLTALTLVDPVVSLAIAVTAFHERLSVDPPRLVIEIVGLIAMVRGIWMAGRRQ